MDALLQMNELTTLSICIRLILATLLGGLIGIERGAHGQPAGIRTFALVCLGAALAAISDQYLVHTFQSGDPSRLAAQVISGIGFLGVGTIIVTGKNYVRGLTTAASLWATACLGISIGAGYLTASLIAFALIYFVMLFLSRTSHFIDEYSKTMFLYLEVDCDAGILSVKQFANENNMLIKTMEKQKKQPLSKNDSVITVKFDLPEKIGHSKIIKKMYEIETIHYIEEIR